MDQIVPKIGKLSGKTKYLMEEEIGQDEEVMGISRYAYKEEQIREQEIKGLAKSAAFLFIDSFLVWKPPKLLK